MRDQPCHKAATYTERHKNRINADRYLCLEWDSNPRSQCLSGQRRFMPQKARPYHCIVICKCIFASKLNIQFASGYEEYYFLGCDAVCSDTSSPIFQRKVLPPSSRSNI
jgi:hypothetical protein